MVMKIHIVRQGEVFEQIVQKYNVPFERLLEANPDLNNDENLEVGSKIRIPTGKVPLAIPNTKKEEALVEDVTPIFLEPVPLDETELSWELDEDEWDDDIDRELEDDFSTVAAPFAPIFPTQPEFQPYFSTSGYNTVPPMMPFPVYPPPVYAPPTYQRSWKAKKESSSTVYQ
jgi:LysM repeat protein